MLAFYTLPRHTMNLPMLPQDKANHLLYGAAIALAASVFVNPIVGLIAAGVAGAAKEALDWYQNKKRVATGYPPNHDVDPFDFLATLAGGALVYAASLT